MTVSSLHLYLVPSTGEKMKYGRSPSRQIPVLAEAMKRAPKQFAELFLELSLELPLENRVKQKADALLTLVDEAFWGGSLVPPDWESDPRKVAAGTQKCGNCGEPGHNTATCMDPTKEEGPKKRQYKCGNCGEPGHNAATCMNPTKEEGPKKRGRIKKTPEQYREGIEARYPGMLDMLGDSSDQSVADEYDLSRQRIHQIRKRLGIEACHAPFDPTPEQVAALGTKTDKETAEEWGVSPSTVSYHRRARGIEVWSPWVEHEKALQPYLDKIGKVSDPKVAKMAGVATRVVFEYRQKNDIKTEVMAPTHEDFTPLDRDEIEELFKEGWSDEEIAEIVGSTKGTIQNIRSTELGLLRRDPIRRASTGERARVLRVWEHCGRNISETARRTDRSPSFVREVVLEATKD